MSIYDITYNDRIVELLPPDKRMPSMVLWVQNVVKQLQWDHSNVIQDYRVGSSYPVYTSGTYNVGDRVIYGQSVYESLIALNTDVPTTANWRVYQNSFLGVETRVKFNGTILVLTYAVNARFKTNFRQPPLQSDIYFTINSPAAGVFISGGIEQNSSKSYTNSSDGFSVNSYSFATFKNFVVMIPVAVYTALGISASSIVRSFIDPLLEAGIIYDIQTY